MLSWHYGPMWTNDGAWMFYVCLELGFVQNEGARGLTDCGWICQEQRGRNDNGT